MSLILFWPCYSYMARGKDFCWIFVSFLPSQYDEKPCWANMDGVRQQSGCSHCALDKCMKLVSLSIAYRWWCFTRIKLLWNMLTLKLRFSLVVAARNYSPLLVRIKYLLIPASHWQRLRRSVELWKFTWKEPLKTVSSTTMFIVVPALVY